MRRSVVGATLIELLVGVVIAGAVLSVAFRMLANTQSIARNQALLTEASQTARQVAHHIAGAVRRAAGGVPLYAAVHDGQLSEASTLLLQGSTSDALRVRAVTVLADVRLASYPMVIQPFTPQVVPVLHAGSLSAITGNPPSAGHQVLISGRQSRGWGWVRGALLGVDPAGGTITIQAGDFSSAVRTFGVDGISGTADDMIRFDQGASIALDGGQWFYMTLGSVWRKNIENFDDPTAPLWGAASELGRSVQRLHFTYRDPQGLPLTPVSLTERNSVASIEIAVTAIVAEPLQDRSRPTRTYTVTVRVPYTDEP